MIKKIILLFFLVVGIASIKAQDTTDIKINLRHISGFKALDFVSGINKFGNYGQIGYSAYITTNTIFQTSVSYEKGKVEITGYDDFFLHIGLSHTVYKIKEFWFINLHYNGIVGVENNNNKYLEKKETVFDYGGGVGINTEIFIIDRLALILNFDEYYRMQNKFGKFHFQVGVGLRIFVQ